jgi:VWFA-related protein
MGRRMVFVAAGIAAFSLCWAAAVTAIQTPAPTGQTFRGGTELLLVDVSVLDKRRQPVRDLKASDFTVLVDGKARPVIAFNLVDVAPAPPPAPAGEASWVRDVAPDLVTNEKKPGRVFVILLDDYSMGAAYVDQAGIIQARKVAHAIVDAMGPDDRAAVVIPFAAHSAQDFTSDRQLLRAAIEKAPLFPATLPGQGRPGLEEELDNSGCDCGACNIQTLRQIAQAMRSLPEQRKVLFNISAGSVIKTSQLGGGGREAHCAMVRREGLTDTVRYAQLANVTIESFDPRLLRLSERNFDRPTGSDAIGDAKKVLNDPAVLRTQSLIALSEQTGGRAVVNNNNMDLQVPSVIAETSAYYLLGVERPPASDGKQHSLQVRVNRKDVEATTRKGYTDETSKDRQAAAEAAKKGDLSSLVDSPLHVSGVPLGIVVAPFPMADGKPALALTLRIDRPKDAPTPRTEAMDFVASLYYPETAGSAGALQQRATMTFEKPDPRFNGYEVHSKLPAKPGRYPLRVGIKTADGRTSSVYTTVIVPDFDDDLSLSGLVLRAAPSPLAAGTNTIRDLLPIAPTSQRTFKKTDDVSAFMRIYQKDKDFTPAKVTTTVTNAKNEKVANIEQTLEGEPVGSRTAATYDVGLPVADLPPGEYLLSVSVTVGAENAGRQLRFTVEAQ